MKNPLDYISWFDGVKDDTKAWIVAIATIPLSVAVFWFLDRTGWASEAVAFALGWTARWFVRG